MEICKEIPKIKNKTCVSIGKFDGVHLGHQTLLEELVLIGDLKEAETVVFTFDPYPEDYFSGKESLHLCTNGEIISELEEIGVDRLVKAKFDDTLKDMDPEKFIKDIILGKLNAEAIVCGSDVSFGKGGKGNADTLLELSEKYGFEAEIIDKIDYKGDCISSSRIIKALEDGEVGDASEMLGYDYYHYGVVVRGQRLASQFELPTVNINPVKGRVIPKHGVYATIVECEDGTEFKAVSNVGVRPTVSDSNDVNIESHLLDCPKDKDMYGARIKVYFLKFIREEKKFDSDKTLFNQIKNDIMEVDRFFKSI